MSFFNPGIQSEPNSQRQRALVAEVIQKAIDDGEFNYTEILASQEPMRSFAFEYLDGVRVQGTIPVYGGSEVQPQSWDGEPVRLVHINPLMQIRHGIRMPTRIPGTNQVVFQKHQSELGNIADVTDIAPERLARNILFQQGWPTRQAATLGTREGVVIEWRWLQHEVNQPQPAFGVREIYEEIAARVARYELNLARAQQTKLQEQVAKNEAALSAGTPQKKPGKNPAGVSQ